MEAGARDPLSRRKGMLMNILVLNCGSSSVKYQVFDMRDPKQPLVKGVADRIAQRESFLSTQHVSGKTVRREVPLPDHQVSFRVEGDERVRWHHVCTQRVHGRVDRPYTRSKPGRAGGDGSNGQLPQPLVADRARLGGYGARRLHRPPVPTQWVSGLGDEGAFNGLRQWFLGAPALGLGLDSARSGVERATRLRLRDAGPVRARVAGGRIHGMASLPGGGAAGLVGGAGSHGRRRRRARPARNR